jgi:hypothetical protein
MQLATSLRFIDLFAGLGGFHLALASLGHKYVLACEVDEDLGVLYEKNFGIKTHRDIRTLKIAKIPAHDILCAGFPCQRADGGFAGAERCAPVDFAFETPVDMSSFDLDLVGELVVHDLARAARQASRL